MSHVMPLRAETSNTDHPATHYTQNHLPRHPVRSSYLPRTWHPHNKTPKAAQEEAEEQHTWHDGRNTEDNVFSQVTTREIYQILLELDCVRRATETFFHLNNYSGVKNTLLQKRISVMCHAKVCFQFYFCFWNLVRWFIFFCCINVLYFLSSEKKQGEDKYMGYL